MPRIVVIGAGAAGTMAAIFAAASGAETLLLERTRDGGRKILISGGGRCNILPARLDESRFVTRCAAASRSASSSGRGRSASRSRSSNAISTFRSSKKSIRQSSFPRPRKRATCAIGCCDLARRNGARLLMNTTVTGFAPTMSGWRDRHP